MVCYDVPVEYPRIRDKIALVCKNYGLLRIQYSVFWGSLTQSQARDLAAKCNSVANNIAVDIRFIAVCAECFKKSFAIVKNFRLQSQSVIPMDSNPLLNILTHTTVGWNLQDKRAQSTAAKASVWVASANAQAASNNAQLSQSQISQVFQAVTNNTMPPLPNSRRKAQQPKKSNNICKMNRI